MNRTDSKDKGDLGVAMVIANLCSQHIKIALPMSEHLPFDLIAINEQGNLSRVSVKYVKLNNRKRIEVPLRTISSNSKGYNTKHLNHDDVDGFAVFCPDTKVCYFIGKSRYKENRTSFIIQPEENLTNPQVLFESP